ncbi:purine and uridine phosphorylase, partial [Colletotrichum zoysiae]
MSDPRNYTVGWICAIPTEFAAACAFLDQEHPDPEAIAQNDNNNYALGTMGKHNVVIAVMPEKEYGIAAAATVARDMVHSFPNVRIGLMVGVGGGAPSERHDIRLGDVVVSSRGPGNGGVIQYDYGKSIQNQGFVETGVLNQPPPVLLNAVARLKADHMRKGPELHVKVERALSQWKQLRKTHSRPSASTDQLYKSEFVHPPGSSAACSQECSANISNVVSRDERGEGEDNPAIHYGLIASANQVMKNAETRDKLSRERGVLCFEMEAAGLVNHFPCLIVRGICDYSDSHKNKEWQGFAAMTAAAYAKDLICRIMPNQLEAQRKMKEVLESMDKSLASIGSTTVEMKTQIDTMSSNSHFQKIRKWLSPPDTSTNYNLARERRHEGTGLWFLETSAFQEWEHGPRKHIWLHGMPGSGKTVLITTVLDHLARKGDLVTLEFFFDFRDTSKQKTEDMCRSLIFQLYNKRIESRKELDSLLTSHDDGRRQPTLQALTQCLQVMMHAEGRLCIVMDALDECVTRSDLLRWLQSVISSSNYPHVRLIATGRPEEEFMRGFRSWIDDSCLPLDAASVDMDIQSYIRNRLRTSEEFSKWASTPSILQQIQEEVGGKAKGMFRWAACQLDSLEKCLDREELEATMNTLPSDLNATYARILQNIPRSRWKKTVRLLHFLVYSKRPLTLKECVDVIAVRVDGARSFDSGDRLPNPKDITRFCPGLVVRTGAPHDWRFSWLQLAHFTVKEYLLQRDAEGFRGAEPSISITETCLFYLASVEDVDFSGMNTLFPLAGCAAEIWTAHARLAESSNDTAAAIASFLQSEKSLRVWLKLRSGDWRVFDSRFPIRSGFYFACFLGLTATVKRLLSDQSNVNAASGVMKWTALQGASEGGNQEIVQLLLDAGANVNAVGGDSNTALQAASTKGNKK